MSLDGLPPAAGIESSIRTLRSLGERKPLHEPRDKAKAEEAMRNLRRNGFSNKDVSELSGRAWAEPTIKQNTRGTPVQDRKARDNAIELLVQMASAGLTLDDVKAALSVKTVLDSKNVDLASVAILIEEANRSKVDIHALVTGYKQTKFQTGLPLDQLREMLSYKQELDQMGFTVDTLKQQVLPAARSFGEKPEKVIEAINAYGSLEKLQKRITELEEDSRLIDTRNYYANEEVKSVKKRREELEAPINAYESLKSKGFDEHVFSQLEELTNKYGGVKQAIEAVSIYGSIYNLQLEVGKLEGERKDILAEIKSLNAKHAHLQTLIDMCDKLLYKYHFTIDAVYDLMEAAKKYGPQPFDVIKALDRFGDLQSLERQIEDIEKKKIALENERKELEKGIKELSGKAEGIRDYFKAAIDPVNQAFNTGAEQLSNAYRTQMEKMKKESEEYGKRFGLATIFEEELNMARVVSSILKFPTEAASKLTGDHAIMLLDAASRFCRAKALNPPVDFTRALSAKGFVATEPPAIALIEIARDAIKAKIVT